jgi:M3 family oligoendopeptidase
MNNSTISSPPVPFDQFEYFRPDIASVTSAFEAQLAAFRSSASPEQQQRALDGILLIRDEFSTMANLCHVRHTSNTADAFYEQEKNYFDEHLPSFDALNSQFFQILLDSPFRGALEQKFGQHLFKLAEISLKTFQPAIHDDLQQENRLTTQYNKIKASAQIEFQGKTYNLSSLQAIEISDDRDTRKQAAQAKWRFYEHNAAEIEGIFDQLVKIRHNMAVKLGFRNFVEVGYARMKRSDYGPEMVANFRRQVREHIVPIATKLYERQRKRLNLAEIKYFDEDYKFASGNPKPIGSPEEIVGKAAQMYRELSAETGEFFAYMQQAKLMDLVNRDNKNPGGYCTYISKYKAPFIFSNFNGTSSDIDVLTHEAGHAFQVWSSRSFPIEEYFWPTADAAEIHSMSMEFFTWPWMHLFFGKNVEKYRFMHLEGALKFMPYGVAVDEFQHIVYENPDMTPQERNDAWRNLERTYLPHRDFDGLEHLEKGRFWQRQSHIFNAPFYYIDYTLAQICAFQFWVKDQNDHRSAWSDYLRLCQAGGSQSFLNLINLANLKSPFDDGCVASVVGKIEQYLNQVDDSKF